MMSTFEFSKYHGTGNDFILIDDRDCRIDLSEHQIRDLCHRRFGIGADGLILVRPSMETDFRMVYFNADGREGSMCGNGGRCVSAFARRLGIVGNDFAFEGIDGIHTASITEKGTIRLKMSDVGDVADRIGHAFADTGSPHLVVPVTGIDQLDVFREGKSLREHMEFAPGGTNVNFVEIGHGVFTVRTFERGVEDETLSCGTGVTAVALVAHERGWVEKETRIVHLKTRGGDLWVSFQPDGSGGYHEIFLEGPAVHVFDGRLL